MTPETFLRTIPMFEKVEAHLIERLISKLTERHLVMGETLFQEGSKGENAYIIKEGGIAISKDAGTGEVQLAKRLEGEVIGELALLDEAPRMARARACQDTVVWSFSKQEFHHLLASSPAAARGVIDMILPRMRETEAVLSRNKRELLAKSKELEDALVALQDALNEAKEARKLAEAASIAKSRFLANMSHELRTPLNSIIGFAELIAEEVESLADAPHELAGDALSIQQASRYLHGLLGNILDLARIEAGRLKLELDEIPVRSLSRIVIQTIEPMAQKQQNELVFVCDERVGEIMTDVTKVQQILLNLLSNANKFTEKGTITLSITTHPQPPTGLGNKREQMWYKFTVSDTGIGMTAQQVELVFEEFAQAERSNAKRYEGTGLGLHISKRLCQYMGGNISATSQPGEGSVFTMWLPEDCCKSS